VSTATNSWQQRIVGQGEVDPSTLALNPLNWRQHPLHQRQALRELLQRVGWVQQVVVNRTSGHLVDGHLRVQLAQEDGAATVPVLYVQLDEEEERLVLASLDPLGALAVPDIDQLRLLLGDLEAVDGDLGGMLDDLIGQFTAALPGDAPGDAATEQDFWPVIRLQVSYDTFRAFERWWEQRDGEDDDEKVRALLDE
jgi:hypothetical protein